MTRSGGIYRLCQTFNRVLKRQWLTLLTAAVKWGGCYAVDICVVLIVLWLLGMVTSYTMGGLSIFCS